MICKKGRGGKIFLVRNLEKNTIIYFCFVWLANLRAALDALRRPLTVVREGCRGFGELKRGGCCRDRDTRLDVRVCCEGGTCNLAPLVFVVLSTLCKNLGYVRYGCVS